MPTIHEQIDEFLAADLHGELSTAEQNALHAHLIECAQCRKDFQEEKNMHKLLNETMSDQKADPGFEQRIVARFRNRVPQRTGLIRLLSNLMRFRAVQITAAAALLLALAQMGKMITGESPTPTKQSDYISGIVESEQKRSGGGDLNSAKTHKIRQQS